MFVYVPEVHLYKLLEESIERNPTYHQFALYPVNMQAMDDVVYVMLTRYQEHYLEHMWEHYLVETQLQECFEEGKERLQAGSGTSLMYLLVIKLPWSRSSYDRL